MKAPVLEGAWAALESQGWATLQDWELGVDPDFRAHMVSTYFIAGILRNDQRDVPADRERARDVVRYAWDGAYLRLAEYDTITIQDRDGRPGKREYARVPLLDDPKAARWIAAALSLVPPGRRQVRGTFGINLFRTFTKVVTRPHRDDEEYCLVYVLDRVGSGAQTRLYCAGNKAVVHAAALEPGDLIIFADAQYLHDVTPLEPPAGRGAHRDAIVCTVNYPGTYPLGGRGSLAFDPRHAASA